MPTDEATPTPPGPSPGPEDVLLVAVEDRIATVTLNRPQARNALNTALLRALPRVMADVDARDDVDVLILTGADPAFCAGLDLKELGSSGDNLRAGGADGSPSGPKDHRGPFGPLHKPVIGAVNGAAITGGLELALHCDLLVASERAVFGDTHSRVGVMPAWGLSVLLPRFVGPRKALEMSLTGNFLAADEARAWGLVNHVVPHEQLLPFARRLAADIAGNDQPGVRRLLATYRAVADADTLTAALATEARMAAEWLGEGLDPAAVEARRLGILARGRAQTS